VANTVIVVPCFNEANRACSGGVPQFRSDWRHGAFVFVDDGSTDNTFTVLTPLQKSMTVSFAALQLPHNVGQAESVRISALRPRRSSNSRGSNSPSLAARRPDWRSP
jgi:dolichyl-phosphate beta-glucosyltransferase